MVMIKTGMARCDDKDGDGRWRDAMKKTAMAGSKDEKDVTAMARCDEKDGDSNKDVDGEMR
jgi:hypothetical protein